MTCGGGVETRGRVCVGGFPGDAGCTGPEEDSRECNGNVSNQYIRYHHCGCVLAAVVTCVLFDVTYVVENGY